MECGYSHSFFFILLFPCLFIQALRIFFYVSLPLRQGFHAFCTLMDPVQGLKQFLWFYFTILCIFTQVFFESHSFSDKINRSKRGKSTKNPQMRFQCGNPVAHPVFVFIIFPKFIKINLRTVQRFSGNIAIWPVHDLQKILPAPVSCCHFKISQKRPADPVAEKIGKLFFHCKRNLIFHQHIDQTFRFLICTKQDCRIQQILAALHSFFQCCHHAHILFSWIIKFLARHRHPFFIWSIQLLFETSGITSDHFHGCTQDILTAPVIHIQKNYLCLRIILCKI